MYCITSINALGEVLQFSESQHESVLTGGKHPDGAIFVQERPPENAYWDMSTSSWAVFPPRPSQAHRFNYITKQWYDPRTTADMWTEVRAKRDSLLRGCDWTQLGDTALTGPQRVAWAQYRQSLRDITTQADPFNISWPTTP